MDGLVFHEEGHTYLLDGKEIPSVTTVMEDLLVSYAGVPGQILEAARQRGTNVHRAIELHHLNDLEQASLEPEIADYFWQYLLFEKHSGFKMRRSEERVFSRKYGYAGTLDLEGELHRSSVLVDIKTSSVIMPAVGPQTAAYLEALIERTKSRRKYRRYALQLRRDGYKLVPQECARDMTMFLSALNIYTWRKKWKIS